MEQLAVQVQSLFQFVDGRRDTTLAVRCYHPTVAASGYELSGSVVEVNVADAPFLVDTVSNELRAHGLAVRVVVHPVMGIERGADGGISAVTPARGAERRESVMHFEVDRTLTTAQCDGAGGVAPEGAGRICSLRCAISCPWSSGWNA